MSVAPPLMIELLASSVPTAANTQQLPQPPWLRIGVRYCCQAKASAEGEHMSAKSALPSAEGMSELPLLALPTGAPSPLGTARLLARATFLGSAVAREAARTIRLRPPMAARALAFCLAAPTRGSPGSESPTSSAIGLSIASV